MTRICAVIPAAGRGTRLGLQCPKILVPVDNERCIWHILRDLLMPVVEHVHVVLAPDAVSAFEEKIRKDSTKNRTTVSVQSVPIGMGDAIFGSMEQWKDYDSIIIVWGDQVNLSPDTIAQTAALCSPTQTLVLPLAECSPPYVQYDIENGVLTRVRSQREGDVMDPVAIGDIGIFALSVKGLLGHWEKYRDTGEKGAQTGELNFIPFLAFLSSQCHWQLKTFVVADSAEARGVNTPEDLAFARQRFAQIK